MNLKKTIISVLSITILSSINIDMKNANTINAASFAKNKSTKINNYQNKVKLINQVKNDMLKMINHERNERKLKSIKFNNLLNKIADQRVQEITFNNKILNKKISINNSSLKNISEVFTKYNLTGINGSEYVTKLGFDNMFNDSVVTDKKMRRIFLDKSIHSIGIGIFQSSKYIYHVSFIIN